MPSRRRTVEIEVLVDDKDVQKSLGNINQKLTKTGKVMSDFGKITAAAFAATGVVNFAADVVRAASDLDESTNAVNVSFGAAADEVLAIGENSAKSFGLAQSEFNQFAVGFKAFADQIAGTSGQEIDTVIEDLVTRISDFASVMNLDIPEAADKFRSGLAGETEPLRKFGIDVSAAAVNTKALEMNLGGANGQLSEGDKILARYQLIMEQTSDTADDFANTADGAANSQRILNATFEDFKAQAGQELIPVVEDLSQKGIQLFDILDEDVNLGWTQRLSAGLQLILGDSQESIESYINQKTALNDLEDAANDAVPSFEDIEDVFGESRDQLHNFVRVTIDAAGAVRDLTSANLEAASPTLALFKAQEDATKAADRYAEAVVESGAGSREAASAARDLAKADAELDAAAQVFAEQGGAASISALEEMLIQAGVLPETIAAIKAQIDRLNQTPVRRDLILAPSQSGGTRTTTGNVFHQGGVIPGPPGSDQLFVGQAGETVTRRSEVPSGRGGVQTIVNNTWNLVSSLQLAEQAEMRRRGLR